ncbi:uncharacterized protein F5891DRAFT_1193330 [Suillus fuscotomentosus]|uniref:Uncharacterized protein n=1 Tax=Suillus fuscotomentosus TaxID=1912939 RepID=A0AAD4DY79_9AGAM|nr:uncharacterized protein F5891DRAFT_1193330 [Suillus fuscotomentosus]KAG1896304.1 hypothetical protein F5891DRAFT_1193330 [Suillus fuscotomentosus]
MKVTSNTKIPAIYWEKRYSACTSRLIEWCKANDEARIKLFSDSPKDAKEEGRPRQQMSTQKKNHIQQLAAADFYQLMKIQPFMHYMRSTHLASSNLLKASKKHNAVNKGLGQTGAGVKSVEELDADPRTKNLVAQLLLQFPWWSDLHGWWRTNPSYNTAFSTADPGQDFASEALEFFTGAPHDEDKGSGERDLDDEDLEPGEILEQPLGGGETLAGASCPPIESDDDLYSDLSHSNKPSFLQHRTSSCIPSPQISVTDLSSLDSPSSTTSPLPPLNLCLNHYSLSPSYPAVARPTNTNQPPDISLDSPPRHTTQIPSHAVSPDSPPPHANEDNFFTDMECQPESSGVAVAYVVEVQPPLTVHQHLGLILVQHLSRVPNTNHYSFLNSKSFKRPVTAPVPKNMFTIKEVPIIASIVELPESRDLSDNAEDVDVMPRDTLGMFQTSESRKRPRDLGAELTKKLADASDSLLLHMPDKSDSKASSKRMKFDYAKFSKELKAREAHAEREHDARRFIATHSHERAMSEDKTRQLELEIRLEEAKYRHLAMERFGMDGTTDDDAN